MSESYSEFIDILDSINVNIGLLIIEIRSLLSNDIWFCDRYESLPFDLIKYIRRIQEVLMDTHTEFSSGDIKLGYNPLIEEMNEHSKEINKLLKPINKKIVPGVNRAEIASHKVRLEFGTALRIYNKLTTKENSLHSYLKSSSDLFFILARFVSRNDMIF
jgi:cob(I)alamin adenosyltransferase